MSFRFDLNKAIKRPIILTLLVISVLVVLVVFTLLALSNKHNKLPGGFETNIPEHNKKNQSIEIREMKGGEVNMNNNYYRLDTQKTN